MNCLTNLLKSFQNYVAMVPFPSHPRPNSFKFEVENTTDDNSKPSVYIFVGSGGGSEVIFMFWNFCLYPKVFTLYLKTTQKGVDRSKKGESAIISNWEGQISEGSDDFSKLFCKRMNAWSVLYR